MPKASTFLMFEGRAEEAMTFYVSLFPGGAVEAVTRYGAEGPGPEGSVAYARFKLAGQSFMCSDSFVSHEFGFTPSISIFVDCEEVGEVDRLARALSENGKVLMPLDSYPFASRFAWVEDRFGISWQIMLPTRQAS